MRTSSPPRITLFSALATLLLGAGLVQAAEALLESFRVPQEYTNGAALYGKSPGPSDGIIGFVSGTAWTGSGANDDDAFGSFKTVTNGQTFSSGGKTLLTRVGGVKYIRTTAASSDINTYDYRDASVAQTFAQGPVGSTPNTCFWASVLINSTPDIGRALLSIKYTLVGGADGWFYLGLCNGALMVNEVTTSLTVYAANTTHLLVGRYTQGPDKWVGWVDPDLSLGESGLGTPAASQVFNVFNAGFNVKRAIFHSKYFAADPKPAGDKIALFDEVRFGTSFSDVTPLIPEPAMLAACALGWLFLLRRPLIRSARPCIPALPYGMCGKQPHSFLCQ